MLDAGSIDPGTLEVGHLPWRDDQRDFSVGEIKIGIFQGLFFFLKVEQIPIKSGDPRGIHDPQLNVMNAPFRSLLDLRRARPNRIDVSPVFHSFLRQVKVIAFGVVSAKGGEGSVGRPSKHGNLGIFLFDPRDGRIDVVDVDAKVVQPRHIAGLSTDDGYTDVTVADTHRVIRPDRFFFFSRTRLRSFHPEYRFVKLCLAHEVFTDNGGVLNSSQHRSLLHRLSTTVPSSRFKVQRLRMRSIRTP